MADHILVVEGDREVVADEEAVVVPAALLLGRREPVEVPGRGACFVGAGESGFLPTMLTTRNQTLDAEDVAVPRSGAMGRRGRGTVNLVVQPIALADANRFVVAHHRHSRHVVGHLCRHLHAGVRVRVEPPRCWVDACSPRPRA